MSDINISNQAMGHTVVYVRTKKIVTDFESKMLELVERWYSLCTGKEMIIERVGGKRIHYQGVCFKGSPRLVFWGNWTEEFFEQEVPIIMDNVGALALEVEDDIELSINEAVDLLEEMTVRVYARMVSVDCRLMGDGIAHGQPYDTTHKTRTIRKYINEVSILVKKKYEVKRRLEEKNSATNDEIIGLKPEIYGISIDLRRLYRRIRDSISRS